MKRFLGISVQMVVLSGLVGVGVSAITYNIKHGLQFGGGLLLGLVVLYILSEVL